MSEKLSYRWFMLALGWVAYFSFGTISSSLSPMVSIIGRDLNLTYTQFGTILGAWPLTYIAVAYVEGMMLDKFGIRKCVMLGLGFLSLSGFLRSFAWDYWSLFTAVAVFGLGGPMMSIGLPKLIAVWFSGGERGTASGIYITGSTCGSFLALSLTNSFVLPLVGSWQNTFRVYAFGAILVIILWFFMGRDVPKADDNSVGTQKSSSSANAFVKVMKYRDVWLVVIVGFVVFLTGHGLANWLPRMFELNGMTPAEAGLLASVPTVTGMLGSISINRMAARLPSRKPIILTILLIKGVTCYLVGVLVGPSLVAALVVYGVTSGALLPLMMLVLMDMRDIGRELMGAAGGLYFMIGEIGGFGGPSVMGYLKDYTGSFLPGVILLSVLTEIMLIPAFIINERRDKPKIQT